MGLIQARNDRAAVDLLSPGFWLIPGLTVGLAAVVAAFGEDGRALLRYDRAAITDGELWRLLSGHFAHLGWGHYLLNAAGVALVWVLVGHRFTSFQWVLALAALIAGIDLGFWYLDPKLSWYVGLSGVLHGLLVAGLIVGWRESPAETAVLLVLIGGKLGYEQIVGPLPGSESAAGAAVVVNAHLYGAVTGAALACLQLIRVRGAPAI